MIFFSPPNLGTPFGYSMMSKKMKFAFYDYNISISCCLLKFVNQ